MLKTNNKGKFYYGVITLAASELLYLIIYAICGFYPFGDLTMLAWDLDGQYLAFLSYFRRILIEGDFSLYTQSVVLGNGTIGLLAYYLMSPFNVLLVLFKEETLPLGISLIILCKHCFSALSMYYFLLVRYSYYKENINSKNKKYMYFSLLSIIFSLSGFAVNMQFNIMWLDGLVILPLMCAGLEKMERENKNGLIVFSLWSALVTNFYIGYMLWIFSFLYFVFLRLEYGNRQNMFKKWSNYVISIILSLGLGMGLILPLLYSLSLSSRGTGESKIAKVFNCIDGRMIIVAVLICILLIGLVLLLKNRDFRNNCRNVYGQMIDKINECMKNHFCMFVFAEILVVLIATFGFLKFVNVYSNKGVVKKEILYFPLKMFIGAFNADEIRDGLPNIYVSSLIVIMVVLFIVNVRIELKEKLVSCSLLVIIFFSMFVKRIDWVWHGLASPHGSNYRYSFLFSFCLILIASKYIVHVMNNSVQEEIGEMDLKKQNNLKIIVGISLLLLVAFALYKYSSINNSFLSIKSIMITVFFYVLIYVFSKKSRMNNKRFVIVAFIVGVELCCNAVFSLSSLEYRSWSEYQKEAGQISEIVNRIELEDSGVYRIENPDGSANYAMLYGYDSISHYSSVMPIQSGLLLGEFDMFPEFMENTQTMYKADATAEEAAILNIKYILAKEPLEQRGFEEIFSYGDYRVYENLEWQERGFLITEKYITESQKDFTQIVKFADCDVGQHNSVRNDEMKYSVSNISQEDKWLVISVAYDKGWSAFLDGEPINIRKAYGSLISVNIPNGEHEVTFNYEVPYLKIGMIISGIFLIICIYLREKDILKKNKCIVITKGSLWEKE